ncbi:MAG: hypothetical protein Athens041674_861, partial [Parcubacteria group bacterium Athens0416_74]
IPARPTDKPAPKKIIDAAVERTEIKEAPKTEAPKQESPLAQGEDDEDSWGGLPSFLRRK